MNKTLISVGVGIWGVMLILNFILSSSLGFLDPQKRMDILFPLTLVEIIAFVITMVGIFKRD